MNYLLENRGVTLLGVLICLALLSSFIVALGRGIFLIEGLRRETFYQKEALFFAIATLEHLKKERPGAPSWGEQREGELKVVYKVERFSEELLFFEVEVFKEDGERLYVLKTLAFQ